MPDSEYPTWESSTDYQRKDMASKLLRELAEAYQRLTWQRRMALKITLREHALAASLRAGKEYWS